MKYGIIFFKSIYSDKNDNFLLTEKAKSIMRKINIQTWHRFSFLNYDWSHEEPMNIEGNIFVFVTYIGE